MSRFDVLIVGAGHGGAQAAIALRQRKFEGSIAIVGDEPELPYERPPLSKEYLAGEKPFERMLIRPVAFWDEREVTMLLGRAVTAVDAAARRVKLGDGDTIEYGILIWATGGRPRALACPGADGAHVHSVRNKADIDRMLARLDRVERVAVIGGGYIGLEAAAVLTKLGRKVVLLEALDRVLARVAGEAISRFYEAEHRAFGVDIRTGVAVDCIEEGRVRLRAGSLVPADLAIVGIGIEPAVEPLLAAGAAGGNGVAVDEYCRTSLPHIYAIGDCAEHENAFAGGARLRLESVQNATDQAKLAARMVTGHADSYSAVPWVWSDIGDMKLQMVGLTGSSDRQIVSGEPADNRFSVFHYLDGRLIGIESINRPADHMLGRKMMAAGFSPDPEIAMAGSEALKAALAEATR